MGIDVELYFKAEGDISDLQLGNNFEIVPARDHKKEDHDITHEAHTLMRYYGKGYERGSWPEICAAIMKLMADERISKVYYGGDCSDKMPLVTIEDVLETSRHYMTVGHRPYTKA